MLARTHRFHGYSSLRSVYQGGQTVRGPLFSLRFAFRDKPRPYRVAVVVSRKVHKSAVVRNRIRRRVYEVVRQLEGQPPAGFDMVLTVFSDQVAQLEADKLRSTIQDLLKKAVSRQTHNTRTPVRHAIVEDEGK
ncbi:MAG: ribonuclease P protein component [Candidatus Saccharimonadales bacterium]